MRQIVSAVLLITILFGAWWGYDLSIKVKQQKELKENLADINRLNYGIFNMQLWKEKALDIFSEKIQDFKISPQVYRDVEKELGKYLHQLYDEYIASGKLVNSLIEDAKNKGNLNPMFAKLIKNSVTKQVSNFGLEEQIPTMAATLSQELKKNEPMLVGYLQEGLGDMLFDNDGRNYTDPRIAIYQHFGYETLAKTNEGLKSQIASLDKEINTKISTVYGVVLAAILISLLLYNFLGGPLSIGLVTMGSIVFLVLGVLMPMIDIDARLNAFDMSLIGANISFDEQYMYYQSKSILEVTKTLIEGGGLDLKIVGVMILLFSIVVPFFKLVLSAIFLYSEKIRRSGLVKAIIYHLGKWSMADVFVVAMFMAYIGFYGLITSQLQQIERNQGGFAVETLNYSKLSPGALFFTTYCILSIITGIMIKKWEAKNYSTNADA